MLGIITLICLALYCFFKLKHYHLTHKISGTSAEWPCTERTFEFNSKAVKYQAFSVSLIVIAYIICLWPFSLIECSNIFIYFYHLATASFFPAMCIIGIGLILYRKNHQKSITIGPEQIELDGINYINIKINDIKTIHRNGNKYKFTLNDGKQKQIIISENYNQVNDLFHIFESLRQYIKYGNNYQNNPGFRKRNHIAKKILRSTGISISAVIYISIFLLIVFQSYCCIQDSYSEKIDTYAMYNAIGSQQDQKENAWDYYSKAAACYIELDEQVQIKLKKNVNADNYILDEQDEKILKDWYIDNLDTLELIKKAGSINYCHAEYDPFPKSESRNKYDKDFSLITSFIRNLYRGYIAGVLTYDQLELFDMLLSTARHFSNERALYSSLISYGFVKLAITSIDSVNNLNDEKINLLKLRLNHYFPDNIRRINFQAERIEDYSTYRVISESPINPPYPTPFNLFYILAGTQKSYISKIDKQFDIIEDKIKNNITITEAPDKKIPSFNILSFQNIINGKILQRAYRSSREASTVLNSADLIFALEQYKIVTGTYPADISDLTESGYEAVLPEDAYSPGNKIIYRNDGVRAVLYSVGKNRIDDKGHNTRNKPDNKLKDHIYWERILK